jgi:hypothetical protein
MIIRNANMSLVVRDAVDVLRKISALVDAKGGYVAETKQWKENEQVRASATVRVPATQLSSALAAIRGFAVRIESESITAQDVSQESCCTCCRWASSSLPSCCWCGRSGCAFENSERRADRSARAYRSDARSAS